MKKRFIFIFLVLLVSGPLALNPGTAGTQPPETVNRAVFKIDTLTCWGCFSNISQGLEPLEGYSGMATNLLRKLVAVDFKDPLTVKTIASKLSKLGYPGELKKVDIIQEKKSFKFNQTKKSCGSSCCGLPRPGNPTSREDTPQPPAGSRKSSCCTPKNPAPGAASPIKDI